MTPRARRYVAATALVLALVFALRLDLRQFAWQRAEALLATERVQAAQTVYRVALALGLDPALPIHALGVYHYRAGRHEQARQLFDAAIALARPAHLPDLYYNRGNSHFRLAEAAAEGARDFAASSYARAIADFDQALALQPGAADALANLQLARARLAAELAQADRHRSGAPSDRPQERERANARRPEAQRADAGGAPPEGVDVARKDAGSADDAPTSSDPVGSGTPRQLSQDEAGRLLREAREREGVRGMPLTVDRHAAGAPVIKDW